ncbi:MAG: hypothetical protein WCT85_02555 [Parachlamydiales bacterium]|jgi:hypothetical protein
MTSISISLSKANSIDALATILSDARTNISFWGSRYVTNKHFSSTVTLTEVTKKALSLLNSYPKNWDYSTTERTKIKTIMEKIDSFYSTTSELIQESSFLTRLFCCLRETFSSYSSVRKAWKKLPDMTNFYSKNQYLETFPNAPLSPNPDQMYQPNSNENINLYLPPPQPKRRWFHFFKK